MSIQNLIFQHVFAIEENKFCFDCKQQGPEWVSLQNSILLCLGCAGLHRNLLGAKISQIKSISMDEWTEKELKFVSLGGNKKLADFLFEYGVSEEEVQRKYKTCAAYFYRYRLNQQVELKEIKQEQPVYVDGRQIYQSVEEFNRFMGIEEQDNSYRGSFYRGFSMGWSTAKGYLNSVKEVDTNLLQEKATKNLRRGSEIILDRSKATVEAVQDTTLEDAKEKGSSALNRAMNVSYLLAGKVDTVFEKAADSILYTSDAIAASKIAEKTIYSVKNTTKHFSFEDGKQDEEQKAPNKQETAESDDKTSNISEANSHLESKQHDYETGLPIEPTQHADTFQFDHDPDQLKSYF